MEKYEINSGKILTRKELKNIKDDGSLGPPSVPSGGDDIKPYKCCRTETTIYSACVECTSRCTFGAGILNSIFRHLIDTKNLKTA